MQVGGTELPPFTAPQTWSSAFSASGLSLSSPLYESSSEDWATGSLLGLLSATSSGLSHPKRGAARTPHPGELSRQAPCYGETAEKQTSRWISITFPVPERALPARRRRDAEAEPR